MQYLFNEKRAHGTYDFPFAYYHVDATHPRYMMQMHWHREFELMRVLSGTFELTLNEKTLSLAAGDFVFIHSGVLHSGIPTDCEYECLVFDLQGIRQLNSSCDHYIQRVIEKSVLVRDYYTEKDDEILAVLPSIFDSMRDTPPGYEMIVTGAIYHLLGIIFSKKYYVEDAPHAGRNVMRKITQLKSVLDFIDENYMHEVTLQAMADAASMTPKSFCRFFKQVTGNTPMDFVNRQRIEHACYEINASDLSLTDIALSCGFNDLSYFIKTFKRYMGVTPGQYQR